MLNASRRVVADSEVAACPFGDGLALLDLRSGQYFTTNAIGAFIWNQIEAPISVGDLRAAILARYDIEADVCAHDLDRHLNGMVNANLASLADATSS